MILGVTPARGGSKGIMQKNIRNLLGRPLLAWTIEAAKKSNLIDKYVVSTEDANIYEVAKSYGAEVLPRPPELATDDSTTLSVLQDILTKIDVDIFVVLQATCPIRYDGLIDQCITRFIQSGADSLATGFICKYVPYGSQNNQCRQKIPGFFYDDGNVFVIKSDLIRQGKWTGDKIEYFFLDKKYNIDIDDEFDFFIAEQILKNLATLPF